MKPNLFKFGTSELTHDAILAWCLAWGNYKEEDLYNLSKDFIRLLTGQEIEIKKIDICQQKHHIDILVKVNDEILIVIEDKIDTGASDNQLDDYRKAVQEEYPAYKKFYNYITVGDEDSYLYVEEKGYKVIERKDLLALIKDYKDMNKILRDYYDYLLEIEKEFKSYEKEQDLSKWTWRAWNGFFKEKLSLIYKDENPGWSYVSNPRGGFRAFYWAFTDLKYEDKTPFNLYLQVEALPGNIDATTISLKIRVDNKDYRRDIRNYVWNELEKGLDKETNFQKPKRFGNGRTMTVAEIRNFKTRGEFFNVIKEAHSKHRYLEHKIAYPYFDFDIEPEPTIGDDMLLINGKVPEEKIGASIILITCSREEEKKLEEFIRNEDGVVFVFEDEPSMDHFRRLFQGSKYYLDEGFNLADLQHIGQSKENRIKFLKYISGIENYIVKKEILSFMNESNLSEIIKKIDNGDTEHIWVLKDKEDKVDIEGFYII